MQFFIRRYLRGEKGSGTADVFVSDEIISLAEFEHLARSNGPGKYLLCMRGKGIRGFKKLDELIIEDKPLIFDAETVSVKQNLSLNELSQGELLNLMGNMIKSAPGDSEGQQKFMADLESFHSELEIRNQGSDPLPVGYDADTLVSAGFPIGTTITSFMLGALAGGIMVWLIQKNTIDDLKTQISSLEGSVKEAEQAINKVKKQADELERTQTLTIDQMFLNNYNSAKGFNP